VDLQRIFAGLDHDRLTRSFEEPGYGFLHHSKLVAPARQNIRQNISSFFPERCFSSSLRSPK
jgi:hypothetical protein